MKRTRWLSTVVLSVVPISPIVPALATAAEPQTAAMGNTQSVTGSSASYDEIPPRFRKWLGEEVGYIITDEEREAFVGLHSDNERKRFIKGFWDRRNTNAPGFEKEHYRRRRYANEHFAEGLHLGWKTDRGRIYIIYGPPDEVIAKTGTSTALPFEHWRYRYIRGVGDNVAIESVDAKQDGVFLLTALPRDAEPLYVPAMPAVCPHLTRLQQMGMIDYNSKISVGASLGILVARDNRFDGQYTVQPDGMIHLPLVGSVQAAGGTVAQLQHAINAAVSGKLGKPQVDSGVMVFECH